VTVLEQRLQITEEQSSKETETCPEGTDVSELIQTYFDQDKKLLSLTFSVQKHLYHHWMPCLAIYTNKPLQ
jgi:hypothetical protein